MGTTTLPLFPSTPWSRFAVGAAIAVATMAVPTSARADAQNDAKDLFARGRDLRSNNDCGSAAPLFRKAYAIYPDALGPLRNLAECEEQLGHFASARRSWLDLKRALITMPNNPKYEGWEKEAEDAAARLKPKVATFVVDVYIKSPEGEALANEKSGVEIFVNGESVGTSLVGTPLERDPAQYRIRAQTADATPVEQTVVVSAGDNPHVTIRLTRTPKPKVAAGNDHSGRRTVGWVVAGVGAAVLVGGGVTFLLRNSAESDVDEKCPSHENCDRSLESTVDRGRLMSTLTNILVPVGIVGLGAGVALILTSGSSSPSESKAASIRITPSLGGMSLSGRF